MYRSRHFAKLADTYRERGELEKAIEVLTGGLEMNPEYVTARIILAACYSDKGDPERALDEYKRVLELDPFHTAAMKKAAVLMSHMGRREEAMEFAHRYLEDVPDDPDILGLIHGSAANAPDESPENDPEELNAEMDTPLEQDFASSEGPKDEMTIPGEPDTVAAEGSKKEKDSRKEKRPERSEADELIATMTLAEIYASQGFYDKAIEIYKKVLTREPANQIARKRIEAIRRGDTVHPDTGTDLETAGDHSDTSEKVDHVGGGAPGEIVADEEYVQFKKWLAELTRNRDTGTKRR